MKYMGYVKWAEALGMVMVEHWPRSYRSRAKAQGQDPTMLWLGRRKGFKDFSVRANVCHL